MKKSFLHSVIITSLLWLMACSPQQEAKVNVMTFNIRMDYAGDSLNSWKYRKDHVGKMLNYYEPDIVGMQEVVHNQLEDLKARLPQHTALGVGRADGKEKGEYGPIFYKTARFELLDYGNYGLSETPDSIGLRGWDAACERIVTWAILKDRQSGKKLACFNTHFDHIGQVARRESAHMLIERRKEIAGEYPAIITGDFNATPDSEIIKIITNAEGIKDTREVSAVVYGPQWTFHNFGRTPVERRSLIDYVFVDHQIEVNRYCSINDTPDIGFLSDHNPVMVALTIK